MCRNVPQLNCSETNADIEDTWKLQLKVEDIIMAGLFSLLAVVTVTTNLLVLASSISINQRLRCPTYLLILSLSVADLSVGLLLLPTRSIELLSHSWTRQFIWCKVTLCLNLFSLSASLLNLLAVTFDRFLAISYSLMYNTMITKQRIYVAITAVWLTAFFMILFPLCGVGIKPSEDYHPQRVCSYGDLLERKYLALFFASICTVPTMIITVAYFKIFVLARSQERRIASLQVFVDRGLAQSAVSRGDGLNRESKAAKTVGTIDSFRSVFRQLLACKQIALWGHLAQAHKVFLDFSHLVLFRQKKPQDWACSQATDQQTILHAFLGNFESPLTQ